MMPKFVSWIGLIALAACGEPSGPADAPDAQKVVEPLHAEYAVPGRAAAGRAGRGARDRAVIGVRRVGPPGPGGLDERFQLGSNTKAMTATAIASVVEDGQLSWTSTLESVFPALASK